MGFRNIRRTLIAATLSLAAVTAVTAAHASATGTTSTPSHTVAIGVAVAADDNLTDLDNYTAAAGRNPAILMWYSNWGSSMVYSSQLSWNDTVGSTPMVTWEPSINGTGVDLASIASGSYDTYIDSSATQARNYRKPMLIRFGHEMNLAGSPYGPGHTDETPANFVAAWQHIVARFAADKATNVRWVWSPNVNCGGQCPFDSYYPGDSYVSYVALDGYNYAALHHIAPQTFSQVFSSSYADLTKLTTKPVIIAETATDGSSNDDAAWTTAAFNSLASQFPKVVALIWFDRNKETDWRVDSTSPQLTAWQNVVNAPANQASLTW